MSQFKVGKNWYVSIYHNKCRYRKISPDNSKSGAQVYEATLRRKLAEGISINDVAKDDKQAQRFEDFAWFWFRTHVLTNNKPSMIAKTKGVLTHKLIPHFGNTPLIGITALHVEEFKAKRARDGVCNKTINGELGILGKCLRDAQRWLGIEKIPDIVMLKVPPHETYFLTEQECALLLSELWGIWHDIAYVALKTGLRLAELQALEWKDVSLERKTLVVKHSLCSISRRLISPKSNKARKVPLTDDVVEILNNRRNGESSGYVFAVKGGNFRPQSLNRELARACKRAGVAKITCHGLRHTYASHLNLKGVDILVIKELLGHADIKQTMRYTHTSQESLNSAAAAINRPFQTQTMRGSDAD